MSVIFRRRSNVLFLPPSVGGAIGSFDNYAGQVLTHHVAPFASVSGATFDDEDRGATAWSNATNPLTPTTLGTALRRADDDNVVGCRRGVYTGPNGKVHPEPSFWCRNSGSPGHFITFVCEFDPLTASPENRTRFTNGLTTSTSNGCSTLGFFGRNYQRWINPYIDASLSQHHNATGTGTFHIFGAENCELIRPHFDGYETQVVEPADTHAGLFIADAAHILVDNGDVGGYLWVNGAGHNTCGSVVTFDSRYITFRNCDFHDGECVVFWKYNDDNPLGMGAHIMENCIVRAWRATGLKWAYPNDTLFGAEAPNQLRNTLFDNSAALAGTQVNHHAIAFISLNAGFPSYANIYNNTFYKYGYAMFQSSADGSEQTDSDWYNNFYFDGRQARNFEFGGSGPGALAIIQSWIANGLICDNNGARILSERWADTQMGDAATPADFFAQCGLDQNSVLYGSGTPYPNAATGDFTLAAGPWTTAGRGGARLGVDWATCGPQ